MKPIIERFYNNHAEWIELSNPTSVLRLLKEDFRRKGYIYYKPINGYNYRSKIN